MLGFGAAGPVKRTPVILLHGNNDTPYPTACNPFGDVQALADYLRRARLRAAELWALGYQGDQCDLLADPTSAPARRTRPWRTSPTSAPSSTRCSPTPARSASTSSGTASAARSRASGSADHAGTSSAPRRDRQPEPRDHQLLAQPAELLAAAGAGGFTPDSAICREYGAADTPFLTR